VQEEVQAASPARTLQDLCSMQTPLLVGLISMLGGSTLQDDIALTTRQLVAKGQDILGMTPGMNLERSLHEKRVLLSGNGSGKSPFLSSVGSITGWRGKIISPGVITPPGRFNLFLVSVADADGLSYYSDASLTRRLKMDCSGLRLAPANAPGRLIAYEEPLYQVLSLDSLQATRSGSVSVGEILRKALGGQP